MQLIIESIFLELNAQVAIPKSLQSEGGEKIDITGVSDAHVNQSYI